MRDVVVVEAVRSPVGRRKGGLSGMHAADLLGEVQRAVVERSGIDPAEVGQVVGGCVGQVGMQAANVTRTAWLQAGLPLEAAATTVNTQCGSSQQATNMATALVAAGVVDVAVACGVEVMSAVPMGSTRPEGPVRRQADQPQLLGALREHVAVRGRRAHRREVRRHPRRARRVRQAVAGPRRGRVGRGPLRHADRARSRRRRSTTTASPNGTQTITRDEGLRDTTLEALANLKPVLDRDPAFHTAGTASQISDGAGALLLMTAEKADALGLEPKARIVDTCIVGSDPVLMLTGPIPATEHLLERNKLTIDDIDLVEINEAFASVVLGWQRATGADMAKVNPNGGAIALGHPLGGTGTILLTKAVHELERSGQPSRAGHDVLRRRPRHRHHPRTHLTPPSANISKLTVTGVREL